MRTARFGGKFPRSCSHFYVSLRAMKNAFVQLHAAVLLASCSGILGNLISLDAVMVTWYRMLLAGLVLMAVLVVRERRPAFGRTDLKVLAVGALLALHWILFYASIKCSNVSVGVVCFCLSASSRRLSPRCSTAVGFPGRSCC